VTSEGVLLEEYIGKYNLCHSDCRFYCIFGTSLPRKKLMCNCKKIPNIEGETKYLVFVSYHLARAKNG